MGWCEHGMPGEVAGRRLRLVPAPPSLLRALGRGGDLVKRIVPFEYPLTRESMEIVTRMPPVPSSPELEALGVRFRDPAETYRDALQYLVVAGHLRARHAPAVAASGAA